MDDLCLTLTEGKAREKAEEESRRGQVRGYRVLGPLRWGRCVRRSPLPAGSGVGPLPFRSGGWILCHPWISVWK